MRNLRGLLAGLVCCSVGAGVSGGCHPRAGEGALIGAAVGAIGGALIGHSMDAADSQNAKAAAPNPESDYDRRHAGQSTAVVAADVRVSKADVIKWTLHGTSDELIIDRIDRSGTVFHLDAADENELRDHGVSETVINAMIDTSRK